MLLIPPPPLASTISQRNNNRSHSPLPPLIADNQEKVEDLFDNCRETLPVVSIRSWSNRFYTPKGNASATCDCCGLVTLAELQTINPRIESNFTAMTLPSGDTIVQWARAKVLLV